MAGSSEAPLRHFLFHAYECRNVVASLLGPAYSLPGPSTKKRLMSELPKQYQAQDAQGLEQYLPYLTEASLFGLNGFALG